MKPLSKVFLSLTIAIGMLAPLVAQELRDANSKQEKKADKDDKVKQHSGPIADFKKINVEKKAFEDSSAQKPLVLKTEKDAKKYFDKETLAKIKKVVDFDARHVIVFAWRGSGRDKLSYSVMESYPEQIAFSMTRGRTRDLRSHVRVFSVRKNVKVMVR